MNHSLLKHTVLLAVIALVFALGGVAVRAGTLSPSAAPAATGYTLGDIYGRLTTNASATAGDHSLGSSGAPAGTFNTMTQIYDAIPTILANTVKLGTSYLGVAGTLTPDGGTATAASLFTGATAHLTDDWTLDTGTLSIACATSTFDGTDNLAADAYDGDGDGTNRFCITDSGTATAGGILSGLVAWIDGVEITGTMTDRTGTDTASTARAAAGGVNYFTAPEGYYDGTARVSATDAQVAALDADIAAGNIADGIAIFGVTGTFAGGGYAFGDDDASYVLGTADGAGTALSDMWNGTRTDGGFPGGDQENGGVDDYNNADPAPADRYAGPWTACDSGNNYCGTGLASADARDDSTGLVWSLPCAGVGCTSFSDSSPLTYSWDNSATNNNSQTAQELCSAGSHGESGWTLPNQKQLMQAYIDGSYGNLEASDVNRYYWSSSTVSNSTTNAWRMGLSFGGTSTNAKTNSNYLRCVRPGN